MPRLLSLLVALLLTLPLLWGGSALAQDVVDPAPFDAILKAYVDDAGQVAYAKLKGNEADLARLDDYLKAVGAAKLDGVEGPAKLAFYINAYNAHVIRAVIDALPTTSVMKVPGFFKKATHPVAGQALTLDALEHQRIRQEFAEPRIHFALVCAAKSCPRLQREAYTAANLEAKLEAAAKEFVPKATEVEGEVVKTSQLFNWFAADFEKAAGSVGEYLARYLPAHAEVLTSDDVTIRFTTYDWALNAQ